MTSSPHISSLTLDAFALEALGPEEDAAVRRHLARCARCDDDLGRLRAAHRTFQGEVLPRTLPALRARAHRSSQRRALAAWLMVPSLAAAVAVVVLIGLRATPTPSETYVGAKGTAILQIFASRDGSVFPVHDGSELAPGDRLRFVVWPAGLSYLLIASVDGTATPTIYFPYGGKQSGALEPGQRLELPGSIVLDAAPGPERLYAIFSRAPISADEVKELLVRVGARGSDAIRGERTLKIRAEDQVSVGIEKVLR
jgi:hypothetical protein